MNEFEETFRSANQDENCKIVIPIGSPYTVQELIVVEKKINGDFILHQILPVRFVPLTGDH